MNAAVVGYGAIGPVHAKALDQIEEVNLYAVCDIVKERADKGAQKYGAKAYYDYDECLKDENIDYIHICTPHYLHFEMIKKALDNGKRVVVEKPVVMKKEELDILFADYDTKKIFPIFQNRTNVCVEKLKELVAKEKDLGKLLGVKGVVTWSRGADYYQADAWRGTKDYEGGGVLINQTLHTFDLMMLFGGAAKSVSASMHNYSLKDVIEVEDTACAYIDFENGAKGIFFATNAYTANSSVVLELHFENKLYTYEQGKLFENGKFICEDAKDFAGKSYWGAGHAKMLHDLYADGSTHCLDDAKNTMQAMFMAYESAEKGDKTIL